MQVCNCPRKSDYNKQQHNKAARGSCDHAFTVIAFPPNICQFCVAVCKSRTAWRDAKLCKKAAPTFSCLAKPYPPKSSRTYSKALPRSLQYMSEEPDFTAFSSESSESSNVDQSGADNAAKSMIELNGHSTLLKRRARQPSESSAAQPAVGGSSVDRSVLSRTCSSVRECRTTCCRPSNSASADAKGKARAYASAQWQSTGSSGATYRDVASSTLAPNDDENEASSFQSSAVTSSSGACPYQRSKLQHTVQSRDGKSVVVAKLLRVHLANNTSAKLDPQNGANSVRN